MRGSGREAQPGNDAEAETMNTNHVDATLEQADIFQCSKKKKILAAVLLQKGRTGLSMKKQHVTDSDRVQAVPLELILSGL